jgi:hypothetical protein
MKYMIFRAPVIAFAAALAAIGPAAAQGPYDKWFGAAGSSQSCLMRTYNGAHLKTHPKQQVEKIAVQHRPKRQNGTASWEGDFELAVGFKLRGKPDWFSGVAYCKGGDVGMPCSVEGDGGSFTLAPTVGSKTGLTLTTDRLAIEGARKFAELGKGDDRTFNLTPASREACGRLFEKKGR